MGITGNQHEIEKLRLQLTRTRQYPFSNLANFLIFQISNALSNAIIPLPRSIRVKFQQKALKHNPIRSLQLSTSGIHPHPTSSHAGYFYEGKIQRKTDRKNVLIVTHEAHRTGAPILALNLAAKFSEDFNVTVLCLRGGELVNDFQTHSVLVFQASHQTGSNDYFSKILTQLSPHNDFEFAIVNSIEARHILPALRKNGVTSISLLHEFASYTLPRNAFHEAFRHSDQLIFSTELTLLDALNTTYRQRTPNIHIIPQGKCYTGSSDIGNSVIDEEKTRLRNAMRPQHGLDSFVVLGAGTVQYRKGVDIFITVAQKIFASHKRNNIRFVWIGDGYAPDFDKNYSVYLRDQIERSGISDRITIIEATPQIEFAYKLADALLITSRLDPLPNVGIDAITEGIPVLCFNSATGIAPVLKGAGVGENCVADYLDADMLSKKLSSLISSSILHQEIRESLKKYACENFDFLTYYQKIKYISLSARVAFLARKSDIKTIVSSEQLRVDFIELNARKSPKKSARKYVDENWNLDAPRKPEPGFHPMVYWEALPNREDFFGNPYAEFLRQGRPPGPWTTPIISGSSTTAVESKDVRENFALHIHAYYPEELTEIIKRLNLNHSHPDIYISTTSNASSRLARQILDNYNGYVADIQETENRGRNFGPLITLFGQRLIKDYNIIGHLHTKRSPHSNRKSVQRWTNFLLENLIGGPQSGAMMDRIIAHFIADPTLGIAYPDDPNILSWNLNLPAARRLAVNLNISSLPSSFNFPVGGMFWTRSAVLQKFVDLNLTWDDYPREPLPYDGTILHAIERLLGIVPGHFGYGTAVTNTKGVTR